MSAKWYTESGGTGTLEIEVTDDGVFLVEDYEGKRTKCLGVEYELEGVSRIDATVKKFMQATGDGPNFVFIESATPATEKSDKKSKSGRKTTNGTSKTINQRDDSMYGRAKKRARKQGRDVARSATFNKFG